MKLGFIVLFSVIASFTSSLFSQSYLDKDYLKAINHIWSISYNANMFNDSDSEERKEEKLLLIRNSISKAKVYYNNLEEKYPEDKDVKELGIWVEGSEFLYKGLYNKKRKEDPQWVMMKYLLSISLGDYVKDKL